MNFFIMCGISAIFSSDEKILENANDRKNSSIKTIKRRGPDKTAEIIEKSTLAIHTNLKITGNCRQPYFDDRFLLLFNGEIYNDFEKYTSEYSDTHFLINQFSEHNLSAFENLDGEFAICIKDMKKNILYLATDPFATKPLYYQLGPNYVAVGSYEGTVKAYGNSEPIIQMKSNSILAVDLNTFEIISQKILRPFDFTHQNTLTYDNWNTAFSNSILKRSTNLQKKLFVSFSSGHDSGLIAAELLNQKIPFHCYTNRYKEDISVLEKRFEILKDSNITNDFIEPSKNEFHEMHEFLLQNCEPFQLISTEHDVQNFSDSDMRNVPGYIAFALICKRARDDGRLICLSGQGSDEIFADYYNPNTNSRMSELKCNWNSVTKPWKNFYAGWNRVFLGGTERIAGLFGIETRYPFLDFEVIQEFLNLHPKLKDKFIKAPVTNRLNELDFPYHLMKQGFAGAPVNHL